MQRYHRMGSLDSDRQTADIIMKAAYWSERRCSNGLYRLIGMCANVIMRAAC